MEKKKQFTPLNNSHLMGQARELLKIHFGYGSFRPGQEKVIDNVLVGESTMVIMPTGGGKSLCYQLPALVLDGITIVISPLIALMKDQVDSLNKIGAPATFINSSISQAEAFSRLEDAKKGQYKLLYIAPERFYNAEFTNALKEVKVDLFAVDEAHCISQWGHDFRPSYLKLKEAIKYLGSPTVLALTATATPKVRADIIKQLNLTDPEIVITGFARPNLQFGAVKANDALKPRVVLDAISSAPEENGIVYVGTRARADELLSVLLENNIEAVGYHAGMEAEDRKWVQENFMSGKAKVIVATNAFGLGIDKRDIRFVIHYDMPGTVEAYYQEAGRAGRDGKPSFCLLLYSSRDRYRQEFFIKGDNPPPEIILEIYEFLKNYESDKVLITYSELAANLSDEIPEMAVGTALRILEREGYISRAREKNGNAFLKLKKDVNSVLAAVGVKSKKSREILEKMFGRFSVELEKGWDVNLDEAAGILEIKKESLARLARKLAEEDLVEYRPPFRGTEINILKRTPAGEVNIDLSALKEKLKSAHAKLDEMEAYVYHFGCRQSFILNYFGEAGHKSCGKCDNCLTGNGYARKTERPERRNKFSASKVKINRSKLREEKDLSTKAGLPTKLSQLETFDLYNKGMDIEEMAQARNLTSGTIVQHLCFLIKKGLPVSIDKFVDKRKQKEIKEIIKRIGAERLAPIKEAAGENVSYDKIRLVAVNLKKEHV